MMPVTSAPRSIVAAFAAVGLCAGLCTAQHATAPEATKPTQPQTVQLQPVPAPGVQPAAPGVPVPTPPGAMADGLKLTETKFDWGDIPDTDPVHHDLQFTNISDKTITLAVAASCGCTVAQLEKSTFAPGESGKVTATFSPQGRFGPQTKTLTFTITNPQGVFNQQMATLSANVKALITYDPPKMYLNEVDHRKGQTAVLTLTGRKAGFRITKAEPQNEFVTAKIGEAKEVDLNGEKLTQVPIELEIGKGAPIGNFQTNLVMESNDAQAKIQPYFLGADIIGDVKSTPPQAILRVNTPVTPFTTQIRLDSRSGSSFNVMSVDVEGPKDMSLVADTTRGEEGKYFMVTLSGVTPTTPGMKQGYLIVGTDAQGGETMRIPFTAVIQAQQPTQPAMTPTPVPMPAGGGH